MRQIVLTQKYNATNSIDAKVYCEEGEMMFNSRDIEKMVEPAVKTYVIWHNIWNAIALAAVVGLTGLIMYFFKYLHVALGL